MAESRGYKKAEQWFEKVAAALVGSGFDAPLEMADASIDRLPEKALAGLDACQEAFLVKVFENAEEEFGKKVRASVVFCSVRLFLVALC